MKEMCGKGFFFLIKGEKSFALLRNSDIIKIYPLLIAQ